MTSSLQIQIIKKLKVASIQYQHEKFLKKRHFSEEGERFFSNVVPRYQAKLSYFFSIKKNYEAIKTKIGKESQPEKTIAVRKFDTEDSIRDVARKASVYFQQGLEMLETSISMPENTSPLVEYYALLQCAKGFIILDLDVKEELFFTQHGLSYAKDVNESGLSNYLNADIKPLGVFSALAIRGAHYIDQRKENNDPLHYSNELEDYFNQEYKPSIESIVVYENNPLVNLINQPLTAFIGSWMLSSLVRYAPMKWQEILSGQENDLIKHIREFRESRLILAFDSFLPDNIR